MSAPPKSTALSHIRICDFTGQLAGAGATRWLAAMGAQVIRIEDPVNEGRWDILRGVEPHIDDRSGVEFGGGFQNHNVEKLGITLNLRTERGKELLRELVRGQRLCHRELRLRGARAVGLRLSSVARPSSATSSTCRTADSATPVRTTPSAPGGRSCRPRAGSRSRRGCPGLPPAGWGYSYMDHHGGNIMAIAILTALVHRQTHRRGSVGRHVVHRGRRLVARPAGARLHRQRSALCDATACRIRTAARSRRWHRTASTRAMGDDDWIAVSCRDDADGCALAELIGRTVVLRARYATLAGRLAARGRPRPRSSTLDPRAATSSTSRPGCRPWACPQRRCRSRRAHRPRSEYGGVGSVADRAAPRDGRGARRRRAGALQRYRLGDRTGRAVSRRAQRTGIRRVARAVLRGDRTTYATTGSSDGGRRRGTARRGPLAGMRVIELASERACFAGKLLAIYGAEVIVVEPPGGHHTRAVRAVRRRYRGPRAQPVVVALQHLKKWRHARSRRPPRARCAALARRHCRHRARSRDARRARRAAARLSRSARRATRRSSGCRSRRSAGPARGAHGLSTDLTVLAGGGPVWSCGYDDHSIPPVRGGGNQGYHTGSIFAVMSALTACASGATGCRPVHRRQPARRGQRHHRSCDL